MIWLTADEHYYHHNILMHRKTEDGRQLFRATDEMHRHIRKNHNALVSPDDIVYHLGDFAYGPGAKSWQQIQVLLHGLNGTHHLIMGNHDHIDPFKYIEAGFTSVHTSLMLEDYLLIHDPAVGGVLRDLQIIHGHTHGIGLTIAPNLYCVCVEMHDYNPVPFSQIKYHFENLIDNS